MGLFVAGDGRAKRSVFRVSQPPPPLHFLRPSRRCRQPSSELMIMGFISLGVFLTLQFGSVGSTIGFYTFEFAHIVIFFTTLIFVMQVRYHTVPYVRNPNSSPVATDCVASLASQRHHTGCLPQNGRTVHRIVVVYKVTRLVGFEDPGLNRSWRRRTPLRVSGLARSFCILPTHSVFPFLSCAPRVNQHVCCRSSFHPRLFLPFYRRNDLCTNERFLSFRTY